MQTLVFAWRFGSMARPVRGAADATGDAGSVRYVFSRPGDDATSHGPGGHATVNDHVKPLI